MPANPPLLRLLLPVLLPISVVFLVTGALLATLPLHVHGTLGFGADVVGGIAGAQFVAAVASRIWAGQMSDRLGPRRVMLQGLAMAFVAGLACFASVGVQDRPVISVVILLVSRAMLGAGESFIITAGQSWGLALAGTGKAAAVIGWAGTALYLSLAAGGPLGGMLGAVFGFGGVAGLSLISPLVALPFVLQQKDARNAAIGATTTAPIFLAVLRPGFAAGFAGMVYAAMAFFAALMFEERGWQPAWGPFTAFALALILIRVTFSNLPDRLGARRTILTFLIVQIASIVGIVLAPNRELALLACFTAGIGYAFIYPSLGREAVSRVPAEATGRALAYYSAFFDLSMALSGLLLGQLAASRGLPLVFYAAILGSVMAFFLMLTAPVDQQSPLK